MLADIDAIVSFVQDTHELPGPGTLGEVRDALQAIEDRLQENLRMLQNPALSHVEGELEAYLELKHDLQRLSRLAKGVHIPLVIITS